MDNELSNVNGVDGIKPRTVGERLRQERGRLGLSQEHLAERVGVHRRTQVNYELDRSEPSGAYLTKARALGIDTQYVLNGVRSGELDPLFLMKEMVLRRLLEALGYEAQTKVPPVLRMAIEEWGHERATPRNAYDDRDDPMLAAAKRIVSDSPTVREIKDAASNVDVDLLAQVIAAIDRAAVQGAALTPDKRARLVALAYRQSHGSRRLDPKVIADLVALAA